VDDDDGREGTYRNIVNANNDSVRNNHNLSKRCYPSVLVFVIG
jgi:hypothetical protein